MLLLSVTADSTVAVLVTPMNFHTSRYLFSKDTCWEEMTVMTLVRVGDRGVRVRPRPGKVLLLLLFHRSRKAACWCSS